jgi:NTP pyrophosphatase (non-canonical NTP hydrolase)
VDIVAYQKWFAEYDRERGLDLVEPSQVTVHLMEEVGEIAREVLYLEGYRDPDTRDNVVGRLSEELGDAIVFLTKIAQHYGVDLDTVMRDVMTKAEGRWPLDEAQREMARYMRHQQASTAARAAAWKLRTHGESSAGRGDSTGQS